jgi:NAD(P)-dependent dehydrogenase (short-subunit alcohol dehydrogenase family)
MLTTQNRERGVVDTPWFGSVLADAPDPAAAWDVMRTRQPLGRMGQPEEIAAADVCHAVGSADVAPERNGRVAGLADLRDGPLGALGMDVRRQHPSAGARQRQRRPRPMPDPAPVTIAARPAWDQVVVIGRPLSASG